MEVPAAPRDADNPDRALLRKTGRQVGQRLAGHPRVHAIGPAGAAIWVVPDFLDRNECARLIAMIDAGALPSMIGAEDYSRAHRTSDSADFDPADPFVAGIARRIDDLLGIPGRRGETIQGQRYFPGQDFKPHVDWFVPHTDAWHRYRPLGGQRSFTAMTYLNRVEAGGETDFPLLDIAVQPRAGALLVWNNADTEGVPDPAKLHAGNPVTAGVKYVFTRWYRCGTWRAG